LPSKHKKVVMVLRVRQEKRMAKVAAYDYADRTFYCPLALFCEKKDSIHASENPWRYKPPTISEVLALAKLNHDIVRHYLSANYLKSLVVMFQVSNYEFLVDSHSAIALLSENR
jgi:hypothetical protein